MSALIVSVHLPKTGGMTLLEPLLAIFGDRLQRAYHPPVPGLAPSFTDGWPDVDQPLCVHGHAVFRRFGHLAAAPGTRWVTFLRDPLDRAVSTWHHRRRHRPWSPADRPPQSASLPEFLLREFPPDVYATLLRLSGHQSIRELDVVGVTERFDASMFLLYRHFGWPDVPYRRRNTGDYTPPDLDPAIREAFEQRCAEDYRIYRDACGWLDERIAAWGAAFDTELQAFLARVGAP